MQDTEHANAERDQARTRLIAAQAGHQAQLQVLQDELTTARTEAAAQRERAALAELRAETAESTAHEAGDLPTIGDIGGMPGVRADGAAVLADGEDVLLRDVQNTHTGDQARELARALLAVAAQTHHVPGTGVLRRSGNAQRA